MDESQVQFPMIDVRSGVQIKQPHVVDLARDERGVYGVAYGVGLRHVECLRPDKIAPPIIEPTMSPAFSSEKAPLQIAEDGTWWSDDAELVERAGGRIVQREGAWRQQQPSLGFKLSPAFLHGIPKSRKSSDTLEREIQNAIWGTIVKSQYGPPFPKWAKEVRPPSDSDEAKARRRYFAARTMLTRVFTSVWKEALRLAADQDALKLARRFPMTLRLLVYRLAATSRRRLQAIQVCPVLVTYCYDQQGMPRPLADAIERGDSVRTILKSLGIPWLARKLLPATAFLLSGELGRGVARDRYTPAHEDGLMGLFGSEPAAFHAYLPKTAMGQFRYIHAVQTARGRVPRGSNYCRWIMRNAPLHLKTEDLKREVGDVADWYEDMYPPQARRDRDPDAYLGRPEYPPFGWTRALELSVEWHRTIEFRKYKEASKPFPKPWLPGDKIGGYQFVPLTDGSMLIEEGRTMHHCVATYAGSVVRGDSYIYSVRHREKPVATLEIAREREYDELGYGIPNTRPKLAGGVKRQINQVRINQIRGACNAVVSDATRKAAEAWIVKHAADLELPVQGNRASDRHAGLDQIVGVRDLEMAFEDEPQLLGMPR